MTANARLAIVAIVAMLVGVFVGLIIARPDDRLRAELIVLQLKHDTALKEIDVLTRLVETHEGQAKEILQAMVGK